MPEIDLLYLEVFIGFVKDIAVGYALVYMHDIVDVPGNTYPNRSRTCARSSRLFAVKA